MEITPIRTEKDYRAALRVVSALVDPVEAIKFRMHQAGLSVKDLEPMIGQPNRVYEVLSRKRPLTLRMIRNLNKGLGISAQVLITDSAKPSGKLAAGA